MILPHRDADPEANPEHRDGRLRRLTLVLTAAVLAVVLTSMALTSVVSARQIEDRFQQRLRADLVDLREVLASDQALVNGPGLTTAAATIEQRNVLILLGDGTILASRVPGSVPPVPSATIPSNLEDGTSVQVTFVRSADLVTGYLLLARDAQDGAPIVLAVQRTTPPTPPASLYVITATLSVSSLLLLLLPTVRRRDRLLQHQETAVAGLVSNKADVLRQMNQVERTKGDFLTAVSHQFRGPLQVIQGMSRLLADPTNELTPQVARELADRLSASATELDELLRDLLDVDRLNRGVMEPARREVNVTQVIEDVATRMARPEQLDVPDTPVTGNVDVGHLERMVEHVLRNALSHSPVGAPVEIVVAREDGAFRVEIADRGPGISAEHRLRVFDPLYRIHKDEDHDPSVGIGLALVQRLAGAHGGRAWAEPREGGGTKIILRIPDEGEDRGVDLWQLSGNIAT